MTTIKFNDALGNEYDTGIEQPNDPDFDLPKGKRTIRRNIYGNLKGYIGGRFWICFGDAFCEYTKEQAERWVRGEINL